MKKVVVVLIALLLGCSNKKAGLMDGDWRGVIELQGQELPFNFTVSQDKDGTKTITLINAGEKLELDSIDLKEDSVKIRMHIFDAEISAKIGANELSGFFFKNYAKDYKLPFKATYNSKTRFEKENKQLSLPEKYKIQFEDDLDSVYKVGIFESLKNKTTGTVLTTSGDHRYLEGITTKDSLFLSAFDGEHAYLYKAKINADLSLNGRFYSGKAYNVAFTAIPNDTIELPNADSLTFLKPGFTKFSFSFPGIDDKIISLDDPKYQDKVVIVQLLGSWCPNCMDETKFLAPWYLKNKEKGVEVIGLAYEKKDDFDYAKKRLSTMKERLNVKYDIAFAGSTDKENTSRSLPMLNRVMAFPTTIFIDKKGKVRKIHTGFSGPGTGKYYEKFVEEFNETVNDLVSE